MRLTSSYLGRQALGIQVLDGNAPSIEELRVRELSTRQ